MNLIRAIAALSFFSWIAVLALVAYVVARAARGRPMRGGAGYVVGLMVFALAVTVLAEGLVFIQPEERGVVISTRVGGLRPDALQPGLHWIIPFAENVIEYPISKQTYTMSIAPTEGQVLGDDSVEARTADGQVVFVDASIIFGIDPKEVISVHINWQDTYADGLVRTTARGIIRDGVAQFGIEEVYSTRRLDLTEFIRAELEQKLEDNGLILYDLILRNIAFSPEYAASVEQKQVAEQQAEQARFVVDQRRQEAEQARQQAQGLADARVIQAQGEAEAIVIQAQAQAEARLIQARAEAEALRLLGEALAANPDVLILQWIEKIAPNISVILLPSENPFLLPLPGFTSP